MVPEGKPTSTVKPRIAWIDIAKGIAIILVIFGHTLDFGVVRDFIFAFHMPLFFILAGYTFRVKPMGETVRTSAKRLLVPYVLIFLISNICIQLFQNQDAFSVATLIRLTGKFVFASGTAIPLLPFEAVGVAWFLVCLFFARILMNLLMMWFEKRQLGVGVQFVVFFAMAALGMFIGAQQWYLPFSFDIAMIAASFMWVGYQAKRCCFMERFGTTWYVVVLALVLYVLAAVFSDIELAARSYVVAPLAYAGSFAGTLLCCQVSVFIQNHVRPLKTYLAFMGRNSMLIYCFHALDWFFPWTTLAAFEGVPFAHLWGGLLRVAYATGLTLLVKRV